MTLSEQLTDFINAAFSGLWILTHEADEAEREIARLAREHKWKLATWDVAEGLRLVSERGANRADAPAGDPLAVLRAASALAEPGGTALLLLHNFHRFLSGPEVVQTLFGLLVAGKQQRVFVVVLAPEVRIPIELEKLFVVLEHALPDRGQLERIARELLSDNPDEMPTGEDLDRVLDAAAGLTRYEAEGAYALSLTRHGALRPDAVWRLKAQALRKGGLLTLHRGGERFDDLGGLAGLKDFCKRALRPGRPVRARGVLLLGVSGTGKSAFAKALGNETGRPTLVLDIGSLLGSLVGQSEANLRQTLRIADAQSPCVLFVDELEKALAGVGGQGDSGVSTRLFGNLLTWLSDHSSDVFFVGTSNDISKLPPEFSRAERFDGIFFLDLPSTPEKAAIWAMYRHQYAIPDDQSAPDDTSWTGAEIRACCRLAVLLGQTLTEAARQVVPVAVTAADQVERLRSWASGRCLSSSTPGLYQRDGNTTRSGRRVQRGPSAN
jgi:hypothetical protein